MREDVPDRYDSVHNLLRMHRGAVEIIARTRGRDRIAIVAPHAGGIEPLTGELAAAIAGRRHRLYIFAGVAASGNASLHVTSTRFDEKNLRDVLKGARTAIAIHGGGDSEERVTQIGGRNQFLRDQITEALRRSGFDVIPAADSLAGVAPRNLVNRVPEGGVQLELSLGLRRTFLRGRISSREDRANLRERTLYFGRYVETIRGVLELDKQVKAGDRWRWLHG